MILDFWRHHSGKRQDLSLQAWPSISLTSASCTLTINILTASLCPAVFCHPSCMENLWSTISGNSLITLHSLELTPILHIDDFRGIWPGYRECRCERTQDRKQPRRGQRHDWQAWWTRYRVLTGPGETTIPISWCQVATYLIPPKSALAPRPSTSLRGPRAGSCRNLA